MNNKSASTPHWYRMVQAAVRWVYPVPVSDGTGMGGELRAVAEAFWIAFRGENLSLRAGYLSFITLSSLAPMVVVGLVFFNAFHRPELSRALTAMLEGVLAPGQPGHSEQLVDKFLGVAASRHLGSFSFIALIISSVLLLRDLDTAINEVWAVQRKRHWLKSMGIYGLMILLGPFLVAVILSGAETFRHFFVFAWGSVPNTVVAIASASTLSMLLTLLYKFSPQTPLRWRSAIFGAFLAGCSWELLRHTYRIVAHYIFSSSPVLGTVGLPPLFLGWIFVSWWLLLFGARLAYALENAGWHAEFADILKHPRAKELLGARIAQVVACAWNNGGQGVGPQALSLACGIALQPIVEVVNQMVKAQLLELLPNAELIPSRDLTLLTLADVSKAVGGTLADEQMTARKLGYDELEKMFLGADDKSTQFLSWTTWQQLVIMAQPISPTQTSAYP